MKKQSVVATQLRTLATAMTAPTSAASGGGSDTALIANYLDELVAAYPDIRTLPAFTDASAAAARLRDQASAGAAVDTASALNSLAVHFDALPDATLSPQSLANTASALELKREAKATFAAIPDAFHALAGVFAGRPDDLFVPVGLGGDNAQKLTDAVDAFVSTDHAAARFYLTTSDDPYSTQAFATVRSAQDALAAAAPGFGAGATVYLGGPTAQFSDVQTVLSADFNRVGVITVIGIFLVLVLLLRALVAPLYLVGTVLLSYLSAVGLSAFLFQNVLHQPGVSFYLPLMVFVLLVALGSDYNIFLMSRVREESEGRPIKDGIRIASGHTGAVITSAGLILAGTFGSMATAPLTVLFQVGVAVAIGVLIDTFLVRSILVPAITTLVGERAWWPSGLRIGARAPVAAGGAGGAAVTDVGLAVSGGAGGAAVADAGLAAAEAAGGADAPAALTVDRRDRRSPVHVAVALGLAVLVPVTFGSLVTWAWQPSSAAVSVRAAVVNADQGATVTAGDGSTRQLALGTDLAGGLASDSSTSGVSWSTTNSAAAAAGLADGTYGAVLTIPPDFSRTIAAIRAGTTGSTPAATLHLETGGSAGNIAGVVARSVSDAITAAATRDATASYVDDVLLGVSTSQASVTSAAGTARDIADRTKSLASDASGIGTVSGELVTGLGKLASGASSSVDGAAKLASGTSSLASGAKQLAAGAASLASGAGTAADGASALATGASSLAGGLATLDAQTKGLPAQATALAMGAAKVADGASKAAAGAASLSAGLSALASQTTGLGAQATNLDDGAASLKSAVDGYTTNVDQLAAGCAGMGGAAAVCAALAGIADHSADLRVAVDGVHAGTSELATTAPQLEAGIAESASGAATLAGGTAAVSAGAREVAAGTEQLAAGMPALAGGVASLSSGAAKTASGARSLAGGIADLATGADKLATGAKQTASGAAALAAGTKTAASGVGQLSDAMNQAVDGARIVQAETGQLADNGSSLATDAAGVASSLESTAAGMPVAGTADRSQVAARVAEPVTVTTSAAGSVSGGIAPLAMVLALWLGALAAFLALPMGQVARRRWSGPAGAVAASAALGLLAAVLMVAGLRLGVGLEIARLPMLVAVSALVAAAFAAVVGALVALLGVRGWVVAVLVAGLGVAASGYPFGVDALPGPLAFVRPLLPTSWAVDAIRACVESATASVAVDVAVLAAWLLVAVLVTLAVVTGARRGEARPAAA